jgi:uncharacterized protein YigE (DUF2233 family)
MFYRIVLTTMLLFSLARVASASDNCPFPLKSSSESWDKLTIRDALKIKEFFVAEIEIGEPKQCRARAGSGVETQKCGTAQILKFYGNRIPAQYSSNGPTDLSYNIYQDTPSFSKGEKLIAFLGEAVTGAQFNLSIAYRSSSVAETCLIQGLTTSDAPSVTAQGSVSTYKDISLITYHLDLTQRDLELISKDDQGSRIRNANGLMKIASSRNKRLVFATNSGIFDTSFLPLGLHIEAGKEIIHLNTSRGRGNFYLQPNGVFTVANRRAQIVETGKFASGSQISLAVQSGPALLLNGAINPAFTQNSSNRVIRSGVGVKGDSEVFFVISDDSINFYDFASFFKEELHCSSALYLDGVISSMYLPEINSNDTSGNFSAMFAVFE